MQKNKYNKAKVNKYQKPLLIFATIIAGVASFIRNRSLRIKFREEQKRKLQEAELKTKDAELQALRNQMNPHFVFNALNSIQNFVFKNDAEVLALDG